MATRTAGGQLILRGAEQLDPLLALARTRQRNAREHTAARRGNRGVDRGRQFRGTARQLGGSCGITIREREQGARMQRPSLSEWKLQSSHRDLAAPCPFGSGLE